MVQWVSVDFWRLPAFLSPLFKGSKTKEHRTPSFWRAPEQKIMIFWQLEGSGIYFAEKMVESP